MINKIRASLELFVLFFALFLFIIGISLYGFLEIKKINTNSHELYADRLLPMDQLGDVRYFSEKILSLTLQAQTKQLSYPEAIKKIHQAQEGIRVNWGVYSLTYLTPAEKVIASKASVLLDKSSVAVDNLMLILNKKDSVALNVFFKKELFPSINPVLSEVNKLRKLQVEEAKNIDENILAVFSNFFQKILLIIFLVFVFAIPYAYYLLKKNRGIINDLIQSSAKLIASEKNYRNTIEYAGEAILILDQATQIIDLNEYACKLLGYTRAELLQMDISQIVPNNELENQKIAIENVKTNGIALLHRKIKRKNGLEVEVEISNRLMEGKGFFAIIHDISERKKAELRVNESEEKYRYLFNINPAHIIIWDMESLEVLEINQAVLEKYGYSRDEWNSMSVLDYRPLEDYQAIKEFAKDTLEGSKETVKVNWRHIKKNGEEMLVEITSHKIIYNNRKAILSLGLDVTERVKTQNKLKQSEEKYHSLIENAGDAIFMVDKDSKIIEVNRSACDLLGYTREELQRMNAKDVYPLNKAEQEHDVQVNLLRQNKITTNETRIQRKDGTIVDVEINRTLLNGNNYLGIVRDITKRKKTEAELFEKKELLQLFVEHSPASLAMFDTEMKYMIVSRRWMSDYNLKGENIVGKSHYEVFPEITQHWKEIHQRCIQGSVEAMEEDSFVRADGNVDWLKWEVRPWYKSSNEIGGIIMFTEVITQRKRADEMFKNQFLNSPDIILYVNKFHKIEAINRVISNGLPMDEVLGANCIKVLPEESRQSAKEALDKCFATKESQEIENALTVGRWVRSRFVPIILNNEVTHVMVFATDLSERKKAERELKQSEEKHRVLTENISDAIVLVNKNLEIEYQSPSAERIAGYNNEETKLKSIFEFIHPEDFKKLRNFYGKSYNSPGIHMQIQFRIIHKEGHIIWIEGTVLNLLEDENIEAFIVNYRDISERKKYENDLIHYNAELKKTNSELDRFVYSASHDLRAPLKSMLGLILITKESIEKEDVELEERLTMLENSVLKLDNFIEDILNYSRNARIELETQEINLKKLVQDIKGNHKFIDGLKELNFEVNLNSNEIFVSDISRISIIFNNIISNAIKYQDFSKNNSFLNITISCDKSRAIILIEDNGIGISEKQKEKVFEMFYRATTVSAGSGLGLYIVKEAIGRLGGSLDLESELGIGTKISIEIPNLIDSVIYN
ncbi:PAS domain S-box protein [Flavobacterium sp.]|uniref:PAS domain S-box protein n=1 Tax=Flavobacterium sp. TaxID=239 RepID=UPI003C67F958